jgi:threonine synthase
MFNCPHTGVALAALRKLVERKVIRSHERVVVISTANGLKFADQKAAYHMGAIEGVRAAHRNVPVELPPDPAQVARAIARHVDRARLLVP